MIDDNGWSEYRIWVQRELAAHGSKLETIQESVSGLKEQVAALKVRTALAAAIAASMVSAVVVVVINRLLQ